MKSASLLPWVRLFIILQILFHLLVKFLINWFHPLFC